MYLPGGHGPMSDLWPDAYVGRILTTQLASGKPLAIVCDGPASILATRIHGKSPFTGYRITCCTDEEEEAVGLASRAPWLLESELEKKIGIEFSRGELWKPCMMEDRNLITGQNPASASVLAERLHPALPDLLGDRRNVGRCVGIWSSAWRNLVPQLAITGTPRPLRPSAPGRAGGWSRPRARAPRAG